MIASFLAEIPRSLRRLRRAPGFALLAASVLALGVAAATALFALVHGVLLRPLPFADPARLVVVVQDNPATGAADWPLSVAKLGDFNARSDVFAQGIAGARTTTWTLAAGKEPERITGGRVTGAWFATLGVQPQLGRLIREDDARPEAPAVAVISDSLWRRSFGADPAILGRSFALDGRPYVVVGVAPRGFAYPLPYYDVWTQFVPAPSELNRGLNFLRTVARLAPGVGREAAEAKLRTVGAAIAAEFPDTDKGLAPRLIPLETSVLGKARATLGLLGAAVGLLLLVSVANFANLLLARGAAREIELAVRGALGAPPRRLVLQQVAESVTLGLAGALLGVGLGALALRVALAQAGDALPRAAEVRIDPLVVGAALLLATAAAALAALPSALALSGRGSEALRGGARTSTPRARRRLLATLVVVEISAATALAALGGFLVRGLERLTAVDPGIDPRGVVTLEIGQPGAGQPGAADPAAYYRRVLGRLRELPGIDSVSLVTRLPVVGLPASTSYDLEEHRAPKGEEPTADYRAVEPGLFALLRVPILAGRDFDERDRADGELVVAINRVLARRHFGDRDPLGARLQLAGDGDRWRKIVAVVGDVHFAELEKPVEPTVYSPLPQLAYPPAMRIVSLVARSKLAPNEALAALAAGISGFDPAQAVARPRPLAEALATSWAPRRFQAGLFAAFALAAAALAAAGVYGVVAYSVAQRREELGIRLALGATARRLAWDVVGVGLRLGALGLALGTGAALGAGGVVASGLYGVPRADPWVLAAVAGLVAAAALGASCAPALSAARTPPSLALRGD
jgi:predicted permease